MKRATDDLHLLEVGLTWPPETFLQWKLQALAERGFRVTVASLATSVEDGFSLPGVELVRLPSWDESAGTQLAGICWTGAALAQSHPARLRRLVAKLRNPPLPHRSSGVRPAIRRLRTFLPLARLRPGVVHFEWESAAVHHLPLFDVWQAPVVVSCHGSGLHVHPYTGGAEHWVNGYETIFRRAAAVHIVSEAMRVEAERFGADPLKTRVIRSAVDPERFRPPERRNADPEGAFRVISVGDLLWVKGHHYALQAISELVEAGIDARFDILGGAPGHETREASERGPLNFTIHDLGLDGRVRLHGAVPSSTVGESLQKAHVLLHASVSEGIPTVVLEAMACGLPVVVTDCGGMREAVTDGVEGFVVPKREPAEMARALIRLHHDPALREEMGKAGRARVLRDFTLTCQVDAFEELYHAVAGDGATSRPGA